MSQPPSSDAPSNGQPATHLDNTDNRNGHAASASERESLRQMYDVYATPFIPSELLDVSRDTPIDVLTSHTKHYIDYAVYTATFAGSHFVPERADIPAEHANPHVPEDLTELAPETYLKHFLVLRNIEWSARQSENQAQGLYQAHLIPVTTPSTHNLFSVTIPGLRDDSPHIEIGDTIQIRQLFTDTYGNLIRVSMPSESRQDHGSAYVSWNRTAFNASVFSIKRADETVFLQCDHALVSLTCNILIPLKERLLANQWNALAFISQELEKALSNPDREAASSTQQTSSNQSSHNASLNGASGTNGAVEESVGDTKPPCNDWIRRMLFPRESDGQVQTELRKLPFQGMFDRLINYEQLQSVNSVSKQNYGVMPFIISGPPGTGKTKTIVETTMQLVHTTDIAHVLVVAPSEPAADTLALRLKKYLTPQQLLRLNGPWRADNEVPAEILSHCHMERGMFYIPPFAQLMKYNVVVTSTRDASILADARVTNNDLYHIETNMHSAFHSEGHHRPETLHWGALLMDEAAQATELDTLAALSIVCPPSAWPMGDNVAQPCFIMAGDQHQLGPRTASLHPEYSRSLFARLAERTAYSDHPLSRSRARPTNRPLVMTARMLPMLYPPFANLTRNYRSHPAILTFPSCEFYNDTLIPEAPVPTTPLQHSPLWKGRGWPVLFVPNSGPDDIERDGGGWYNMSEAKVARDVALHLVMNSGVAERDIVIMSPFAAQVKRLRAVVRTTRYWNRSGMWDVNIGPLEAFQGLESRVVILCVTRTKEKFVDLDVQRGLGVVGQRRQMNVALTRAKEGLIVIGDPKVMKMDPHWRRWLAFCQRNGLVQESLWSLGLQREYQDVGVLERALLAKDELRNNHSGRVLGAAAMLEDEMWTAGLEAALDEYDDGYHEEAESDGDDEATLV